MLLTSWIKKSCEGGVGIKKSTLHSCVDNDGKTNDVVHDIHLRAMKAAEIINMCHGWEQPQEIQDMRKVELAEDCEHTQICNSSTLTDT